MRKLGCKKIGRYTVYFLFDVWDDGDVTIPSPYMKLIEEYYKIASKKLPTKGVTIKWVDKVVVEQVPYEEE